MFTDMRTKSVMLRGKSQRLEEIKQQVNGILQKEREFVCNPEYIKQKKGVKDYLRYLSAMTEVQYPAYWKGKKSHCDQQQQQQPLSHQSELYKEVEKMVRDTWDASKAGHGRDARGLKHTKLVVKQIYLIENWRHFTMYSALRKKVCMEAAVNQFPTLNGLQGEREIKTRTLGMPTFSNLFAAVSYVSSIKDHVHCLHFYLAL